MLEQHGLEAREFAPGSTPTSAMAAEQLGVAVGQIAKSIVLKAKDGRFILAVCPGDVRIDNKRLKAELGCKARMATAEETEQMTGFRPGGVCPFGVDGLEILLERGLEQYDTIYPAAGTDASGVPMTFRQLEEVTGGRVVSVCGEPAS